LPLESLIVYTGTEEMSQKHTTLNKLIEYMKMLQLMDMSNVFLLLGF